MISDIIHGAIICYLKREVKTVSIETFEYLLEMRDDMITFNESRPNEELTKVTQFMQEIIQTFLEELLNKVNVKTK